MSKNQVSPQSDTADRLTQKQAEIQKKLYDAIQGDGLTSQEWIKIETLDLRLATRGYISPHCQQVLDNFTDYGYYMSPYKLSKLVKLLSREFNGVIRRYTQAGRLQLDPDVGQIDVRTTLSDPVSMQKSLKRRKT